MRCTAGAEQRRERLLRPSRITFDTNNRTGGECEQIWKHK